MVFSKMEAYSGNFGITLSKLQQRNSFIHHKANSIEDGDQSMKNSDKSLKIKKGQTLEEEKDVSTRTDASGSHA